MTSLIEPRQALTSFFMQVFFIKPGFVTYVRSTKPISIVCNTEFENSRIFYVKSKRQASKALKLTWHLSWLTEFFLKNVFTV